MPPSFSPSATSQNLLTYHVSTDGEDGTDGTLSHTDQTLMREGSVPPQLGALQLASGCY